MLKTMEPKPDIKKENWLLAESLSRQFIQRRDLHARQLDDGRYVCVFRPFTVGLMYLHLKGEITLGAYLLDTQSQARFTVLDADDGQGFDRLRETATDLSKMGVSSYLETSRRGGHLWLFYEQPITGTKARNFGLGLEQAYHLENIEVYPKQEQLVEGP